MKLRITTSIGTIIALCALSSTASADWIEGLGNSNSKSEDASNVEEQIKNTAPSKSATNSEEQTTNTAPSEANAKSKINESANKADTETNGKIAATQRVKTTIIDTTAEKTASSNSTDSNPVIQTPSNQQNMNNNAGFNMPWGNNNRGGYPMRAMNPMGYSYPPSQNGYYNMVPMMPPQQMMRPQPQMFPSLPYEQQQAQMNRIRLQFEMMAKRVANAQRALAEAHQKAQTQSQAPTAAPVYQQVPPANISIESLPEKK